MKTTETSDDVHDLPVTEDPSLSPCEKQVSFVGTKDVDYLTIHSEQRTITQWIIDHPAVEVTNTRIHNGEIVAATGRMPIGLVNLGGKPRKSNQWARMLSTSTWRERDDDE